MDPTPREPIALQTNDVDLNDASMPRRSRLPDTRQSVTHKFSISGHEGYLIVGLFESGRPGELFIKMAKQGSTMSGLMDTIGILTSLALQYGVPVEALARKLEYQKFEPSGWTPNPDIGEASSVVDYVFRWLGNTFSEERRDTIGDIQEDSLDQNESLNPSESDKPTDDTGNVDEASLRD